MPFTTRGTAMDPGFALEYHTVDLTSLINKLEPPITIDSLSQIHRCTMKTSEGTREVAVKVIIIDPNRAMPKLEKAIRRELRVWLKLIHSNIVPLLGIARVESPWPALVYPWMPSGTLYIYLEKQATTLSTSTKVGLVKGVADGLYYLHSVDVVHGDLQPDNVLIDDLGIPRLTGFGLATVVGNPELQLNSTTVACDFNARWRAPEVIGIESDEPARPTYASDIYSFGSVMFFIISGNIPWKERNSYQIAIALSNGVIPARPENIPNDFWNLIERCWSQNPVDRPGTSQILDYTDQCRIDGSPVRLPKISTYSPQEPDSEPPPLPEIKLALEDLTGQIFSGLNDYVASGAFANVYRCEWRKPSGSVKKVAVKTFRHHTNPISEQDLRRFRRETAIWAHLVHDNIVTLYGTTEDFGPITALVSQWFPDGTLSRLIREQGATLTIESKLKLLHGIASGLYYLHSFPVVHGDITSSNVLVDLKEGEYKACLTDFGLSNVLRGRLKMYEIEGSTVRPGAVRWTAPELLRPHDPSSNIKPTTQNDMYSFGRVMFHLLTLIIPWHDIDEYKIIQKIKNGEDISRPEVSKATSDVTDARWDHIEQCWSIDPSARPCALTAMNFITGELEALIQDDVVVGEEQENYQNGCLVVEQPKISTVPLLQTLVPSRKTVPSAPLTHHLFSTASSLSLAGPLNVLLFGESGVGKSSIINLIMGREVAQTSPDAEVCALRHTPHEVSLADRRFKLWEVSSISSMNPFRTILAKWRLKKSYKKLYRDDGVYLLLYCMRGSRAQRALIKDYKFFTDIVGSTATVAGGVPVAAVVTSLEDYPRDMDMWWTKNKDNLEGLGMRFSAHACITSLPDDSTFSPAMRARQQRSEQVMRCLIYESYKTGTETPRSSSPALTR